MDKVPRVSEIDFLNKKLSYPIDSYLTRPTVYGIIYDEENKIATIKYDDFTRHPFPGGGVIAGETNEQALEREVLEEIGCNIAEIKLIGIFDSWSDSNQTYYPTYLFIAHLTGIKDIPTTTEEYEMKSTIAWKSLPEIYDELANDNISKMIKEIISLANLL